MAYTRSKEKDELDAEGQIMKNTRMLFLTALFLSALPSFARPSVLTRTVQSSGDTQLSPDKPERKHGSVTGMVVDELGKPVSSTSVELTDTVTEEPPASTTTNGEGKYGFAGLLPGVYTIRAKKDGTESGPVSVKVGDGPSSAPPLVLKATGR